MGVPCLQVWQVLTDYEALPEFVPNLALCERLPLSRDMASRMVRLRQVMLCPAPILRTSTPPEVVTAIVFSDTGHDWYAILHRVRSESALQALLGACQLLLFCCNPHKRFH